MIWRDPETLRLGEPHWTERKTRGAQWLEGDALYTALKLGLEVRHGDEVMFDASRAGVPVHGQPPQLFGLIEGGADAVGRVYVRHGPSPHSDWAVKIDIYDFIAWRRGP